MAQTADIDRWLLDAEDAEPGDVEAQITWLRTKRAEYSAEIQAGDWEVQSTTAEGGSASSRRGVSAKENHDAIVGALRKLGATDIGSQGSLLQVQFGNILS
jgi:hypothetical protein